MSLTSLVSGRLGRFAVVGVAGFVLQLLALWALTSLAGWPWLPATAAAVGLAVVHNFVWHELRRATRDLHGIEFREPRERLRWVGGCHAAEQH